MDPTLESPEFIERLRQGDQAAFGQLVKAHHNMLLATARTMLSSADAEEAVQDGWIAAHRAISKFEGRSLLRTWLTRIVINQARMMLRKGGREIQFDPTDEQDALAHRFRDGGHWDHPPQHWDLSGPDALLTRDELRHCMETWEKCRTISAWCWNCGTCKAWISMISVTCSTLVHRMYVCCCTVPARGCLS